MTEPRESCDRVTWRAKGGGGLGHLFAAGEHQTLAQVQPMYVRYIHTLDANVPQSHWGLTASTSIARGRDSNGFIILRPLAEDSAYFALGSDKVIDLFIELHLCCAPLDTQPTFGGCFGLFFGPLFWLRFERSRHRLGY